MSSDLWAAVAAGDVDAARTLLQAPGVDVDAYDADGATLTYVAAAHGHTAMVELLVDEAGADISKASVTTPRHCWSQSRWTGGKTRRRRNSWTRRTAARARSTSRRGMGGWTPFARSSSGGQT